MVQLQKIRRRWSDFCIVAATGPSLSEEIADRCKGHHVVAVNDAYRLMPFADVLYACEARWWDHHKGYREFKGERWSSHELAGNNKFECAEKFGLNLVQGRHAEGFSFDPSKIHYGSNGGFQAINLAIHFLGGMGRIALVGFDMKATLDKRHFFGNHPKQLHTEYKTQDALTQHFQSFIREFVRAAELLKPGIEIVNCTPGSALPSFPLMDLADALPVAA